MLLVIDNLLSIFAPHICKECGYEGKTLCSRCIFNIVNNVKPACLMCGLPSEGSNLCGACRKRRHRFNNLISVGPRCGALKQLVGDYKYNSEVASCRSIARLLAERINRLDLDLRDYVIIPIPTIDQHIRERGFDHMLYVARQLVKYTELKMNNKLLARSDNMSQHNQSGKTRRTMIKKSIVASRKLQSNPNLMPRKVIILDDIWTTGSTLSTAAEICQKYGAKEIIGLTVAYQPKKPASASHK